MYKIRVAIITPTCKRPIEIIERSIVSVLWQRIPDDMHIKQIICTDGAEENDVRILADRYRNTNPNVEILYECTGENTNSYGGGVRHHVMEHILREDIENGRLDYVAHLDDDNILFPHFIKKNVDALEENKDAMFSVCRIIHLGPLPQQLGVAPQVITGIPPVFQNIDTLQVVARAHAMLTCGWDHYTGEQGYYNDGYTYDRLGKLFNYVEISELLGIHI